MEATTDFKIQNLTLKRVVFTLAVGSLFVVTFGIPTALVPTPYYTRMIVANWIDYVYLLTVSFLLSYYLSLFYISGVKKAVSKKDNSKWMGWSGGIIGFLSFACPICNALLVGLLGTGFLMTFFEPIRAFVGLIAIGFLFLAIWTKRRKESCDVCI